MSSRTSSRSTLTTVPSTIWPSSTSTMVARVGVVDRHATQVVLGHLAGDVAAVVGEGAHAGGRLGAASAGATGSATIGSRRGGFGGRSGRFRLGWCLVGQRDRLLWVFRTAARGGIEGARGRSSHARPGMVPPTPKRRLRRPDPVTGGRRAGTRGDRGRAGARRRRRGSPTRGASGVEPGLAGQQAQLPGVKHEVHRSWVGLVARPRP